MGVKEVIDSRYKPGTYDPADVVELVLDAGKIKKFESDDTTVLQAFVALECLSCSANQLTSIDGLPSIASLKRLELQDNLLTTSQSGLQNLSHLFPNLRALFLGGNKMKSVEELIGALTPLTKLEIVDLEKNFLEPDYASRLFNALPNLKVVDGRNCSGQEVEDEEENEEDDLEDDDEEETSTTLKAFYEAEYEELPEDEDEFEPGEGESEDEDVVDDEAEGEEEDEENGGTNNGRPESDVKRPRLM